MSVERQTRTNTTSSSAIQQTLGQGMGNPTWQPSFSIWTQDNSLISLGSLGASHVLGLQGVFLSLLFISFIQSTSMF